MRCPRRLESHDISKREPSHDVCRRRTGDARLSVQSRPAAPLLSVVLVTYKRLDLLERTLYSLLEVVTYPRNRIEIILSDDGSPQAIQDAMRDLPCNKFLLSSRNRGMGSNTNEGIRAATGDYILHLQDDWLCRGPADFVPTAIEALEELPDVGLVRLHEPARGEFDVHQLPTGRRVHVYRSRDNFAYSDRPHIKRRSFHRMLGYYSEELSIPETELEFCRRFEAQHDYRAAFIEGYSAFVNMGESRSFNPCIRRGRWLRPLQRHWLTGPVLEFARTVKRRLIPS